MSSTTGARPSIKARWISIILRTALTVGLAAIALFFYSTEVQADQAAAGCTSQPGHEFFRVSADRIVCLSTTRH